MNWIGKLWAAILESRQRRARADALRHLDARMLRDIGMEAWIDVNRVAVERGWR